MKKRTFASALLAGAILASTTTVFAASEFIQAVLYPVKIFINGQEQELPDEYSILNYNGHAYVPVRFVSEQLGGKVGFIEGQTIEDPTITIDFETSADTPNPKNNLSITNELLSAASQGKLNGIEVALGLTKQEMFALLGEPDETGKVHSTYYRYADTTFYLNNDEFVNVIEVSIDIAANKIKELLGTPHSDGMSDAGWVEYVVGYDVEPNYLYFKYTSKDAETGKLLFKNPRE